MTTFAAGDANPAARLRSYTMRIRNLDWLRDALFFAIEQATQPGNWELRGTATIDDAITEASLSLYTFDLAPSRLGMISAFWGSTIPDGYVNCDGTPVASADYPDLFELLNGASYDDPIWSDGYHTRPSTIPIPDLRARFPLGANIDGFGAGIRSGMEENSLYGEQGSEFPTIPVDALPNHSHTTIPHAHSEIAAVPVIINGGLEAPASAALPSVGTTGASGVTVNATGNGGVFFHQHPSLTVVYIIQVVS